MTWEPAGVAVLVQSPTAGSLKNVKVTLLAGGKPVTMPETCAESCRLSPREALPTRAASGLSVWTVVARVRFALSTVNGSQGSAAGSLSVHFVGSLLA